MFLLFYSLYKSMFVGYWSPTTFSTLIPQIQGSFNGIGIFLTSIFNDNANTFDTLGEILITDQNYGFINITAFVLALITSIGIVVFAVKGIKRIFTIFFQGVR